MLIATVSTIISLIFLIAFVAAMGIPSAIMGFIVWKLERKIAARDKRAEEQDEDDPYADFKVPDDLMW